MKEKKTYNSKAMEILADVFYDRKSIPCTRISERAIFLYEHAEEAPNGTRELAATLFKIHEIIDENIIGNKCLFFDENKNPISLLDIDSKGLYGHIPTFATITQLSKKMRGKYKGIKELNAYISTHYLKNLKNAIDFSKDEIFSKLFQEMYGYTMLNFYFYSDKEPEDCYRFLKMIKPYIDYFKIQETDMRYKKQGENMLQNKAMNTIVRLMSLISMTQNDERKNFLQECMLGIAMALISGNPKQIQENIQEGEEIFQRSVKRNFKR